MSDTDRARRTTTARSAARPSAVILEDEPKLPALLLRAFAADGFRVEGFDRGGAALARATALPRDVAIGTSSFRAAAASTCGARCGRPTRTWRS